MAQVLKETVKNKIYQTAIEEFYHNDYHSATLKNITKNAGISIGLIYSYYKNKESLFSAIVNPIYNTIRKMLLVQNISSENCKCEKNSQMELHFIFNMLKNNRKQFIILIDKSKGTIYENTKEEFIQLVQNYIKVNLPIDSNYYNETDNLFYYILANNFIESILEIAKQDKEKNQHFRILHLFLKQYFYGIKSLNINNY